MQHLLILELSNGFLEEISPPTSDDIEMGLAICADEDDNKIIIIIMCRECKAHLRLCYDSKTLSI